MNKKQAKSQVLQTSDGDSTNELPDPIIKKFQEMQQEYRKLNATSKEDAEETYTSDGDSNNELLDPVVKIFQEMQQELRKLNATSKEDAEEIYNLLASPKSCLVSPNKNPYIAMMDMRLLDLQVRTKLNLHSLLELVLLVRTKTASDMAGARHKANREAKDFVRSEWSKHREAYGGNKSAFARDYVKRVLNEFSVKVTEKQMREVWLADTPLAGKPDGMLADG